MYPVLIVGKLEEDKAKVLGGFIKWQRKDAVGNINDPEGLKKHFAYYHYPFSAVCEAVKMVEEIKKGVENIAVPTLLIHSKGDKTIDWRSSKWIYNTITSKDKDLLLLKKSNHVLFLDYDKETVMNKIVSFLQD